MGTLRLSLAGVAALMLVGTSAASVIAQVEPAVATGSDFGWVDSVVETNCTGDDSQTSEGAGDGYTSWRGYTFSCDLEASDPRVSGTLTGVFGDDCYGAPDRTCVFWNSEEIVNPEGSWTGWVWGTHRPTNPQSTVAPSMVTLLKVFTGHGAYDGLTYILHGQGTLGGDTDFHGLIYEGTPPPPLDELPPMPEPAE